jgi:hypothetical protein
VSARGFLDDAEFEFDCPDCGRTVRTTIGDSRRNRSIPCPGGHTIEVDGSDLDRATRDAERQFDRLTRRLK